MLPVHVVGGLVAIGAGFVALAALKGGPRHRRSGMVFVYAMLTMSATGAAIALLKSNGWGTAMGGFLAFYLVTTGLLTSRRVPGFQFIATASFFLGQAKVIPKPLRVMPLLWVPVLVVLVMMLYWLVRLRLKRSPRLFNSSGPTTPPIRVATALSVAGPSSV